MSGPVVPVWRSSEQAETEIARLTRERDLIARERDVLADKLAAARAELEKRGVRL